MVRFRKKPVEIEAVQFTGDNIEEIAQLAGFDLTAEDPDRSGAFLSDDNPPALVLQTIHGEFACARVGDWVIPEPQPGRAYPCKPDIFAATYEPVEP